ncbi:hypothetical protein [Thalassomonas actiniarum]|uniref:Uncharacterized protein n=1 Tax=Thalassomonas actiniarum TaxID=485447 RepID=A0AAF0C650_9GAMM|nr:hypothetical protein [Thalassomonas actiniarum]WDE01574.1 hypothetical protein SG35_013695 [Thalassomonas actiniarum]
MIIKKAILSVLSAGLFVSSANAIEAPVAAANNTVDVPVQLAAIKNCPNYFLIPGYVYEWRVGADGCRYPVLISKG